VTAGRGVEGEPHARDVPRPVYWPALSPEEAQGEWAALRQWVALLDTRYPNAFRLPECWWRHNDFVEVLAALRDCERACFASTASATGPIEWQRALRDMEIRIEIWTKRLTCTVLGRGHEPIAWEQVDPAPLGWEEFVGDDVARRTAAANRAPAEPDTDGRRHR
jgi:hypothetical protein